MLILKCCYHSNTWWDYWIPPLSCLCNYNVSASPFSNHLRVHNPQRKDIYLSIYLSFIFRKEKEIVSISPLFLIPFSFQRRIHVFLLTDCTIKKGCRIDRSKSNLKNKLNIPNYIRKNTYENKVWVWQIYMTMIWWLFFLFVSLTFDRISVKIG